MNTRIYDVIPYVRTTYFHTLVRLLPNGKQSKSNSRESNPIKLGIKEMSKGIWTKHLVSPAIPGSPAYYFYNASSNRSVWTPPKDGIIHEASNLNEAATEDSSHQDLHRQSQVIGQNNGQEIPHDSYADSLISSIQATLTHPPVPGII